MVTKQVFYILTGYLFFTCILAHAKTPTSALSIKVYKQNEQRLKQEFKQNNLEWGSSVFIRIYKKSNQLQIWIMRKQQYQLFKTYTICYYSGILGTKIKVGDGQAPEGIYKVYPLQMNPFSNYHLSFNIGYPNAYDKSNGYTGSQIMVHGSCVSIGCFAMTNDIIEEIWTLMEAAFNHKQIYINVFIFPFKLSINAINSYYPNSSKALWKQLLHIEEAFEKRHQIPKVVVKNQKYLLAK